MKAERKIFKKGSTTFFISSLFFPKSVRRDVTDLYSFVRVADDYVDQVPADAAGFYHFRSLWEQAVTKPDFDTGRLKDDDINVRVIKNMVRVSSKYGFDPEWTETFLNAMQSDLGHKKCETLDDMLAYVYGSAEVIGLMMARIMRLPPEADEAAMMQGRAMQMINFIRDIDEDNSLQRQYIPAEDLKRFNLPDLSLETASTQPADFNKCIQFQLDRYAEWEAAARKGYGFIPKRLLIPLQTAADLYDWTAEEISRDPMIVFDRKVKPSKLRAFGKLLTNTL